ncbi:MAG TPA: protein translocase subunit SecF [Elusimicrobia bacterium]|nr:protein translocase subunit SecF [Elusimicrobiota bacterium]
MELSFLHNTNIDFIKKRYFFFAVSLIITLSGVVSLFMHRGPNYGIDFTGGVLLQVAFEKPVAMNDVRSALNAAGIPSVELQSSQNNSVIIRSKKSAMSQDELTALINKSFAEKFADNKSIIERTEFVGPSVGKHLVKQAFFALIFSFFGIIVYVAFRFKSSIWGGAGVIGIIHDVFVIVTVFSLMDKEFTLTIVAALLTIAGFSINDTIVIFDRIRENLRLLVKDDFGTVINKSINQTLSRTFITTLTVFVVTIALFFFGGEVIHDFAFALLIGLVAGTYSTVFICSPLVYEWEVYKKRRAASFAQNRVQKLKK